MLSLLATMEEWVRSTRLTEDAPRVGAFRLGRVDVPKRGADVGFLSDEKLGVVMVWESGEVEAEIVVVETSERPLVISTVIQTDAELRAILDRVLAEMRSR